MKRLIATVLTVAAALSTTAVFGDETRLLGESLDSGLGALPANYTGREFMKFSAGYVAGEKQDSGLGSVSREELHRIVSAYEAATAQRK